MTRYKDREGGEEREWVGRERRVRGERELQERGGWGEGEWETWRKRGRERDRCEGRGGEGSREEGERERGEEGEGEEDRAREGRGREREVDSGRGRGRKSVRE